MDVPHGPGSEALPPPIGATLPADYAAARAGATATPAATPARDDNLPLDDDERFIVGLVLTYYRRHPQRARTRLLDLLGEVLTPTAPAVTAAVASTPPPPGRPPAPPAADDPRSLWLRTQSGVAPLKRKK
jgi:hypothetical protein